MQYPDSQFCELAVFNEFAKMSERILFAARNKLDQIKHALHHTSLEFVASLISQDTAQEREHSSLLAWEFQA
jgi:hypothetical protein